MVQTLTCSMCRETKPVTEFNRDNTKKTGYRSRCRACRTALERKIPITEIVPKETVVPKKTVVSKETVVSKKTGKKVVPKKKEERVAEPNAARRHELRSLARREAILRLIDRHRVEFDRLVYSEEIQNGASKIESIPRSQWTSII